MSVLQRIRQRIIDRQYQAGPHLREKMLQLRLTIDDIENVILSGYIVLKLIDDPRGTRYVVEGTTSDYRIVQVPVRFEAGQAVLITVYEIEEE
jgi:hypothetical protein